MNKTAKKSKNRLLQYCKSFMPAIVVALLAAVGGTIFTIIGPDRLKLLVDEIMTGLPSIVDGQTILGSINMEAVFHIGMVLVFFYAASSLLSLLENLVMASVTQKLSHSLRGSVSEKINRMPLNYFDRVSYGDVLSRVTNDVDTIGQAMDQSLSTLVAAITMFVGALLMMLITNWILAATAVLSTVIGFALMMFIMSRSQKHFVQQQTQLGNINGHIEEIYSGHDVVKVYNGGRKAKKVFEETNDKLYESGWKSQFMSGMMQPIMGFIGNFGYVAVCVVGAMLALNGSISFGIIVAFMMYIRLFTQPLSQIAQAFTGLQSASAASGRVFQFLDEDEIANESDKKMLENVKGTVEFVHVRFGYSPDKIIVKDFSAKVQPGQKVALVGPTGAGKTTMVNLLMRFYEVNGGEIRIDGTPISQIFRENVREQFCMVLQDTWLFEGTIRENLVYCKEDVTDEDMVSACKTVGLHKFIYSLPQGYDTVLNDRVNLSQGQRQLLTIARAMIQDAPMLILDEATSSIDTRTEHIIQKAMDRLTEGRTSFVIAHRLSTIKNADMILVMKDGDIIEKGTHEELITQDGFYQDLYNSQFELTS